MTYSSPEDRAERRANRAYNRRKVSADTSRIGDDGEGNDVMLGDRLTAAHDGAFFAPTSRGTKFHAATTAQATASTSHTIANAVEDRHLARIDRHTAGVLCRDAMHLLDDPMDQQIMAWAYRGRSHAAISRATGLPVRTVGDRYEAAVAKMQRALLRMRKAPPMGAVSAATSIGLSIIPHNTGTSPAKSTRVDTSWTGVSSLPPHLRPGQHKSLLPMAWLPWGAPTIRPTSQLRCD
jgi:DNA-directed RNA polymerase specialized sigma24 family protein